jgi:hypothetical protein
MQAPASIETASTEITLTDRHLAVSANLISASPDGALPARLRLDIPGKTSRERHTVVQRLLLPSLFVAPACLNRPEQVGRLLQLWHSAFRAGDAAQLILPVWPAPDHMDRAVAAVQDAAAGSGVDLDVLADIVLTTVPGSASEDVAGVASARACWIALDGEAAPAGSGFTAVQPDAECLRAAARQLAPWAFTETDSHSLAETDSHSLAETADGAA